MKKLLLISLILITINSFAQADSSRVLITVSIQARDLSYIANFTNADPIFEDLDSVMKTKFRVVSPPSGSTNVSISGVPVRAWWWVLLKLSYDPVAINTNIVSRISTVLSGASNNWLSFRISRETNAIINQQQSMIISGASRLQKQVDTQVIN